MFHLNVEDNNDV